MDGLKSRGKVIVIAATNLPDNLDPALRRGRRFDREIENGTPDVSERMPVFKIHSQHAPLDVSCIPITEDLLTRDERMQIMRLSEEISQFQDKSNQQAEKRKVDDALKPLTDLTAQKEDVENQIKRRLFLQPFANQTHGYVGADIEALVREAKLAAMREFISLMSGRSDREMEEAIANVRITSAHFEEAFARVRGSLDEHARTMYSRQAWHILYHQDQQKILTTAADLITRADEKGIVEPELTELRDLIFGEGRKDFSQIKRRTQELDKKYQHI